MGTDRIARLGLAACLMIAPVTAIACDREDEKDFNEVVEDADKELDKLDSDGKDD